MATDEAQPAAPMSAKARGKQKAEPDPPMSEKARGKQKERPYALSRYGMTIGHKTPPKGRPPMPNPTFDPYPSSAPRDVPDPTASMIALHKYRLEALQTRDYTRWLSTENEWQKRLKALDELCKGDSPVGRPRYSASSGPKHGVANQQKMKDIHTSLSTRDLSPAQRRAKLDRTMDIIMGRKREPAQSEDGSQGGHENPIAMDSPDDLATMANEMSARSSSPEEALDRPLRRKKMSAETLLTSTRSPLATADIRTMLCDPKSWRALSDAEQDEVANLLPKRSVYRCPNTKKGFANIVQLRNDDGFRHACAAYATQLKDGMHDRQWLAEAWAASSRRKKGVFDAYLVEKFEAEWDIKVPEYLLPRRMRESLEAFQAAEGERIQQAINTGAVAPSGLFGPAEAQESKENAGFGHAWDSAYGEDAVTHAQPQNQPHSFDPFAGEPMDLITSTETDPLGKAGDGISSLPAEPGSGHRIAGELMMDLINFPYSDSAGSKVASNAESQNLDSRNTTTEGSMSMDIDERDSTSVDAEGKVVAETPGTSTSPVRHSPVQGVKRKRVRFSDAHDELSN